jgi:hypothetical protein
MAPTKADAMYFSHAAAIEKVRLRPPFGDAARPGGSSPPGGSQ